MADGLTLHILEAAPQLDIHVETQQLTIHAIQESAPLVITMGLQGPPGASDAAVVQDSPPAGGFDGQLWFDGSTDVLRVFAGQSWRNQTLDDGFY